MKKAKKKPLPASLQRVKVGKVTENIKRLYEKMLGDLTDTELKRYKRYRENYITS